MTVKRKDFQKASAFINEFLLKLSEQDECAELRDALNLALLHMQRYYRKLRLRSQSRSPNRTLGSSLRDHSPMTPFRDTLEKFNLKWINLESPKVTASLPLEGNNLQTLPLMIQAARHGDEQLMQQLIEKDADTVNHADSFGRTGLMYAAHFKRLEVFKLLLENKANFDAQTQEGVTAMHYVCHNGFYEALQDLIDYGADVSLQDDLGRAAIHWAVTTESVDCLKILLSNGAKVRTSDMDGLTASMWACRMDNIHHFELLTTAEQEGSEDGEDMEIDNSGRTWMHWAVRRKEPLECLTTLLTEDTARLKDNEGKTVLLTAAEQGSLDACKAIVSIAGDTVLSDSDNQKRSALHLSAIGGHGEILNYLLEIGADSDAKDASNATPWDYAKARQLHYCMLIMSAHQKFRNKQENVNGNSAENGRKPPPPIISVSPHPPSKPVKTRPPSAPPGGKSSNNNNKPLEAINREVSSAGNERKQHDSKEEKADIEVTDAFTKCNETEPVGQSIVIPAGQQESEENGDRDEQQSENHHSFSGMDVSDLENEDSPNHGQSPQSDEVSTKVVPSPPPRHKPMSPIPPAVPHHDEYVEAPQEEESPSHEPHSNEPLSNDQRPQPAARKQGHHNVDPPKKLPAVPAIAPLQRPPMTVEPLQEPNKKKKKKKKKPQPPPLEPPSANQGFAAPLQPGGGYVGPLHPPPHNMGVGPPHNMGVGPLHPPHGGYAGPVHPPSPPHGGGYAAPMQAPGAMRPPSPRLPPPNSFFDRQNRPSDLSRPSAPVPPNSGRDPPPSSPPYGNGQRLHRMGSEDNLSNIDQQGSPSPENEFPSNGNNNNYKRYPPPPLHGPLARDQAKNLLGNRMENLKSPPSTQNVLSPMNRRKQQPNGSSLPPPIGQVRTPPIGQTQKLSYGRSPPPQIHAPSPPGGRN